MSAICPHFATTTGRISWHVHVSSDVVFLAKGDGTVCNLCSGFEWVLLGVNADYCTLVPLPGVVGNCEISSYAEWQRFSEVRASCSFMPHVGETKWAYECAVKYTTHQTCTQAREVMFSDFHWRENGYRLAFVVEINNDMLNVKSSSTRSTWLNV